MSRMASGVEDQLAAGGKIRGQQRLRQVAVRVFQIGHRGIADLFQVEAAELGGHAHGDAAVGGYQNIGEGGGQQRRLLHGVVVVVHEVHGVAVDVLEDLAADGGELRLRIPGGGPGHIPGIGLTEVALGVHKWRQQSAVALGETHHRIVDGGVAVGIQAHGLAHDVGGLRPRSRQQTHFIHGVEQLAVGGLEAVDLRDGAGDDDAHGVGHIVGLQRVGDGLLHHRRPEAHDVGVIGWMPGSFRLLLFRHNKRSLYFIHKKVVFLPDKLLSNTALPCRCPLYVPCFTKERGVAARGSMVIPCRIESPFSFPLAEKKTAIHGQKKRR